MKRAWSLPPIVAWGSYDRGKPRVRLLIRALEDRKVLTAQININIWSGIEDKSVASAIKLAKSLVQLVVFYPIALMRLMHRPRDENILVLYPAIIDIFVLWPVARLRRQIVILDAFISAYDTLVNDRRKLSQTGVAAKLLWWVEKWGLNLADVILVDTDQNGDYFSNTFGICRDKFVTVLVGAESNFWDSRINLARSAVAASLPERYILFYGQFIPLHGVSTIFEASRLTVGRSLHWVVIGSGQEGSKAQAFIEQHKPTNLTWIPWVDYAELPHIIRGATVSLGIFGSSDKASRVIPNKVYQVLASGGSIITRESRAISDLAIDCPKTVRLVPAGDPQALADAVLDAFDQPQPAPVPLSARRALSPDSGVDELINRLIGPRLRTNPPSQPAP